MKPSILPLLAFLALGSSASAQTPASSLTRIGAAAAVQGRVQAVAPNATVGRIVESGKPLFLNDHVTTDAAGHLQVLLLDETVFTLGANSDMVLDDFVYDPKTSAGKISASISKGAFRFVTGKVAGYDPKQMKVKLAVGTIGVRGTVVVGETGRDGSTVINAGAGPNNNADERASAIFVSNAGTDRPVIQTGQGVTVKSGQSPSFPHDMPADLARITALLDIAPKNKPAPGEPGGGASAGDASGQLTAAIKDLAIDAGNEVGAGDSAGTQTNQAAQYGPNGLTTWDFINGHNPGGQGYYFSGEAPVTCSGPCASGSSITGSLQLQINFAARTLGGAGGISNPISGQSGSFIHIHGVGQTGTADKIQQLIGLGGSGLNPISFSALTGPATITLNATNLGSLTSTTLATGNFNGSSISLVNAGGVTAAQAQTNMVFTGSNASSSAVSASGTFLSPR
jgi:hypothetical protein